MTEIYLTIAGVGFLLLALSAIFGGEHSFGDHDVAVEHDVAHDIGHEVGHHDVHGDTEGGPSIFSMRMLALFMACFGALGAIADRTGVSGLFSPFIGLLGGVPLTAVGYWIMRLFYSQQASSTVTTRDLLAQYGQVTVPIPPAGVGQISLETKGQRIYQLARTKGSNEIPVGMRVFIVASEGSHLVVEPMEEL